jgi:carbonic anhydrase
MRLFEAIIDANHRAIDGDQNAGVRVADFENELPVVALTCIDPRLNALFPNVLGLPGEQFIWLRTAGNIITSTMSSTVRSLSLACVVKGGKEIAIIGHTDCQVAKTTTMQLIEGFKNLGIERHLLPENINEFFGIFASEQQNVIKGCEYLRHSPIISPNVPVHGLIVDVATGRLEWVVNGYQTWEAARNRWNETVQAASHTLDAVKSMTDFQMGEMKFPETKIGETVVKAEDWLARKVADMEIHSPGGAPGSSVVDTAANLARKLAEMAAKQVPQPGEQGKSPSPPPKIPYPRLPRPRMHMRPGK